MGESNIGWRPNPLHVYSEVNLILFNGVYSQGSVFRIAAFFGWGGEGRGDLENCEWYGDSGESCPFLIIMLLGQRVIQHMQFVGSRLNTDEGTVLVSQSFSGRFKEFISMGCASRC